MSAVFWLEALLLMANTYLFRIKISKKVFRCDASLVLKAKMLDKGDDTDLT